MFFHHSVNGGEPEAGSFSGGLGGKKGVKDIRQIIGGDPFAGISYLYFNIGTGLNFVGVQATVFLIEECSLDLKGQCAVFWHGITGV